MKFGLQANIDGTALVFRDIRPPRPFDMSLSLKCNEHTFDGPEMQKNLPTSLRIAYIHCFFISSSSGNLKNPIWSPFGRTRPLCVHNGAQQWMFDFDAMFLTIQEEQAMLFFRKKIKRVRSKKDASFYSVVDQARYHFIALKNLKLARSEIFMTFTYL